MVNELQATLVDRIWYLSSSYQENSERRDWDFISSEAILQPAEWLLVDWEKVKQGPYIFLSRSPITFAHSVLIIPKPPQSPSYQEADYFRWSSALIEKAIMTFNLAFGVKSIHADEAFSRFAKETRSEGSYQKTLIIKANADEDLEKMYKFHLIPYFESNAAECQHRFIKMHGDERQKRGGLLGWLGQREDEIDKLEIDTYFMQNADIEGVHLDTIKALARTLRSICREAGKEIEV